MRFYSALYFKKWSFSVSDRGVQFKYGSIYVATDSIKFMQFINTLLNHQQIQGEKVSCVRIIDEEIGLKVIVRRTDLLSFFSFLRSCNSMLKDYRSELSSGSCCRFVSVDLNIGLSNSFWALSQN
jgi:hypothetical protein